MQTICAWAVLKRTRSGVDAIEHAMQGVHTSENHERIVSFHADPGSSASARASS